MPTRISSLSELTMIYYFPKGSFRSAFLIMSCAIAASVQAGTVCPDEIAASSISIKNVPTGWTPFVDSPLYLTGAAPIDGPPERRGELAGYTERRGKGETTFVYQLTGDFPDGKWIQCRYGAYGQVTLSQRLGDRVAQCNIRYRKGRKAGQKEIRIQCA